MTPLKNMTAALLCAVAPTALLAEAVELRSIDGFISVDGEIVGYNGTMLSVETSVGRVSVPASQVVCYGAGCIEVIASNDFGLTSDAFQGVVAQEEVAAPQGGADEVTVSFDAPVFDTIYRSVVGAYAMTGQSGSSVEVGATGDIRLENAASNETALIKIAQEGEAANATVGTVSLEAEAPAAYSTPIEWVNAPALGDQLLGLRAFAVIVAPGVELDGISMNELAGIYAGEITNWSEIGGPDMAILPLQLPANSTVRAELVKLVMEPAGKTIAGNVLTMADGISIASSVNQFAGSISVVGVEDAESNVTLPVSGDSCDAPVALSDFNVVSGDYPLIRPLMVSFDDVPQTGLLTDMFAFASGSTAQRLISAEGFANFTAAEQGEAEKNRRLNRLLAGNFDENERLAAAQMFQRLFEAKRLSPTLISGDISSAEAGWNSAMFANLANALSGSDMAGREVLFVGFTNNTEGSEESLAASADAAAAMQAAFRTFAPDVVVGNNLSLSSYGFGGISQATCLDGQVAGGNQSRVEIWVQ